MTGNIPIPGPGHGTPPESTQPPDLPEAVTDGPLQIDRDAVKDVARALDRDFQDLKGGHGKGTHYDLTAQRNTNPGVNAFAAEPAPHPYPGARGIHQSTKNAHQAIPATYANFLTAYQSAIEAIRQGAVNVDDAEDANTKSAQNAGTSLPPAPAE